MESPEVKKGIASRFVETSRLKTHVLFTEDQTGVPVIFLHGNFSAAVYWQDLMLELPEGFRGIAPDIRGYGWSEDKLTDATRGLRDWAEDLEALMDTLEISEANLVGWSLGAAPIYRFTIDHPERVKSITLIAPVSPYGFGGTKGLEGEPTYPDYAGSGGGLVNPEFVRRIKIGDRSADDANSPRNIINTFYYVPPFRAADEEEFLTASLQERIGEDKYPGDSVPSSNWPFVAPGIWGPLNASSAKYMAPVVPEFIAVSPKPPVLWVRGEKDQIVSNESIFDIPVLGKMGLVPGYPGEEIMPPQPMVDQTRMVLQKYANKGGVFEEHEIKDAGHGMFIEKPDEFNKIFHNFLEQNR